MPTMSPQRLTGAEPSAADILRIPPEIDPNSLYYGDCLDVMRNWSPGHRRDRTQGTRGSARLHWSGPCSRS